MLRETMTSTMPVAMIAMPAAWTDIVIMLVGWISVPPLRMWNVTRMRTKATNMPNSRRSISVCANSPRTDVRAGGWAWV
jgi:hypothetical protein